MSRKVLVYGTANSRQSLDRIRINFVQQNTVHVVIVITLDDPTDQIPKTTL